MAGNKRHKCDILSKWHFKTFEAWSDVNKERQSTHEKRYYPYIGHRRIEMECWAYRMRMPSASPNFPGTVPTSHIRLVVGSGAFDDSSESSDIEDSRKAFCSRLLLLRRRPTNHPQLRFSPSVNDSPTDSLITATNTAGIAQLWSKKWAKSSGNIYTWLQRKWSVSLTPATANVRNFTMHWSHIHEAPFEYFTLLDGVCESRSTGSRRFFNKTASCEIRFNRGALTSFYRTSIVQHWISEWNARHCEGGEKRRKTLTHISLQAEASGIYQVKLPRVFVNSCVCLFRHKSREVMKW